AQHPRGAPPAASDPRAIRASPRLEARKVVAHRAAPRTAPAHLAGCAGVALGGLGPPGGATETHATPQGGSARAAARRRGRHTMRAPDARNTATVLGAAAAALIAVPLFGAPASADPRALALGDRGALTANGHRPAAMELTGAGAGHSPFLRSHLSLSSDGRLVAFTSSAFDLVAGDSNCMSDVFVRN